MTDEENTKNWEFIRERLIEDPTLTNKIENELGVRIVVTEDGGLYIGRGPVKVQ